jgi:hypothetical protein
VIYVIPEGATDLLELMNNGGYEMRISYKAKAAKSKASCSTAEGGGYGE